MAPACVGLIATRVQQPEGAPYERSLPGYDSSASFPSASSEVEASASSSFSTGAGTTAAGAPFVEVPSVLKLTMLDGVVWEASRTLPASLLSLNGLTLVASTNLPLESRV